MLAAASCSKGEITDDITTEEPVNVIPEGKVPMVFTAVAQETKSVISGKSILWEADDRIAIFDGSDINEVGYYDIEAWGEKMSSSIEKCCWKGRGVRVIGRLKQNRWKATDGKPMSKIIIIAEHLDFKPVFRKKADGTTEEATAEPEPAPAPDEDYNAFSDASAEETDIGNLQEAAAGLRAEQEEGETVF